MPACPHCHVENAAAATACAACGQTLSPSGPRPRVTLKVVRADGGAEVGFILKKEEAVAGTAGDIILMDDPFVARRQARFFFNGNSPMIEDIGGGNGVFVRLRSEIRIGGGQEMRCGRQRLLLEAVPPPPAGSPRVWGSPDDGCRFRLVQLIEGGRPGDAFPLKHGDNMLARENGDITFPGDGFVSGRHAVFSVRGEEVSVKDVGSSNGTFMRIYTAMPLARGDQLLIGKHLVKVDLQPIG